jgi:outer membrane protein assembly factor BamB
MYVTAGTRVYALNAKTGEALWTWRAEPRCLPHGKEWQWGRAKFLSGC